MENPRKFRNYNFKNSSNLSSMRWTVDYPEDFVFVAEIFKALYREDRIFTMGDILALLKNNPELSKINAKHVDKVIIGNIRSRVYHRIKKTENI